MERIIERPRLSPTKEIEYNYSYNNNIENNIIENNNSKNIMMNYNKDYNKIIIFLSPNIIVLFCIIITSCFAYFIKNFL